MIIIPHFANTNYPNYNQFKINNNNNYHRRYYDCKTNFTGLENNLEKLSPLNFYMRKVFDRFMYISKKRKFGIDNDLKDSIKVIKLKMKKNSSVAWDINPNNSKKYIIFYHGLGQNITSNQELYKAIIQKGYGVFAPEYGGFGESTGNVTAESIKRNTKSAIKYLENKGIKEVFRQLLLHTRMKI